MQGEHCENVSWLVSSTGENPEVWLASQVWRRAAVLWDGALNLWDLMLSSVDCVRTELKCKAPLVLETCLVVCGNQHGDVWELGTEGFIRKLLIFWTKIIKVLKSTMLWSHLYKGLYHVHRIFIHPYLKLVKLNIGKSGMGPRNLKAERQTYCNCFILNFNVCLYHMLQSVFFFNSSTYNQTVLQKFYISQRS